MSDTILTLSVDEKLANAFAQVAKMQDRSIADLLSEHMRTVVGRQAEVEHDAWFRAEVSAALREADDPSIEQIPHDQVMRSWRERRTGLVKRISGKSE